MMVGDALSAQIANQINAEKSATPVIKTFLSMNGS
jgi:hypothetical protein